MITNLKKKNYLFFQKNWALSSKYKCNIKDIILSKNQILDVQENLFGEKLIMIKEYFLVFHYNNAIFVGFLMGNFLI